MASISSILDSNIDNNGILWRCDKIHGRLPNHILHKIFDLLSSIDLTSCWYVSKAWRCLLKDFKHESPKTFILHTFNGKLEMHTNMLSVDIDFDTKNPAAMKIVNEYKTPPLRFVNSCNSLLSFSDSSLVPSGCCCRGCVYILNPMTYEYLKLPETPRVSTDYACLYGFGFSKKSNQYKMIHLSNEGSVHVCVVDSDPGFHMTWKNIGLLPYDIFETTYFRCVYFDGALYWIADGMETNTINNVIICRFDVEDEKFQPIKLPIDIMAGTIRIDWFDYTLIEIGVWGDDFYLLYGESGFSCCIWYNDPTIEIWFMKENGVNDYLWTKHLEIQPSIMKPSYYSTEYPWLSLFKVCENGEILMVCASEFFVLYNPLTKSFRDVKFDSDGMTVYLWHQSVETLSFSSLKKLLRGENAGTTS